MADEARDGGVAGPAPDRTRTPRQGRRQTRVLVVNDDPQTLRHVRDALVPAGYAPVATGDPQELPGLVKSHKPHLALLDLLLPGTDGIELMQRVPGPADLPVIFLSAYGRDGMIVGAGCGRRRLHRQALLADGADGAGAGGATPAGRARALPDWANWPSATTSGGSRWPAGRWS